MIQKLGLLPGPKDAGALLLDWWDERAPFAFVSDPLSHPKDDAVVTLPVPGYRQAQTYTCGYVAAMMVLHYFKPRASENRFWARCAPDPTYGVPVTRLARALRGSGVKVGLREAFDFDDIQRAIDQYQPLIVTVGDEGNHWVVIYGYGERPRRVFVGNGWPRLPRNKEVHWRLFERHYGGALGGLLCSAKN